MGINIHDPLVQIKGISFSLRPCHFAQPHCSYPVSMRIPRDMHDRCACVHPTREVLVGRCVGFLLSLEVRHFARGSFIVTFFLI